MNETIYLDHASATKPYPEVITLARNILEQDLGNPSSVHQKGREARFFIDEAHLKVGKCFGVEGSQVVFTSGATESIHLGVVGGYLQRTESREQRTESREQRTESREQRVESKEQRTESREQRTESREQRVESREQRIGGKVLVSPIAHSCVQGAVRFLEKHFGVERVDIPLQKNGHFDFQALGKMDLSEFDVIVAEHGNSKIGVLQDIKKLGEAIWNSFAHRTSSSVRKGHRIASRSTSQCPLFVVDAAASIVSCPSVFDLLTTDWGPDIVVLSGEKFGGLPGSGALIRREGTHLEPIVSGSHEFGMRGGTENLIGIATFAEALKIHYQNKDTIRDHLYDLHEQMCALWEDLMPEVERFGGNMILGHIICGLLPEGKPADLLLTQCDQKGLCISSGSACSSGTIGGNKELLVLGRSEEESLRLIRLSFGRNTKKREVESALKILRSLL